MRATLTAITRLAFGCGETPALAASPAPTGAAAPLSIATSATPESAASLSAFDQYRRKAMAAETRVNLRAMVDGARTYYASERADRAGKIIPAQFPATLALAPATSACKDGKPITHMANPAIWGKPGWTALSFTPRGPFRYQYEWVTDGKTFTARAIGDLDCDGVTSTFEEFGGVNAQGDVWRDTSGPRTVRPLE
ncbi:MAG: hypothetical protein ACI9U2_002442 [Bradymonadia bacterium]|jgi:hypothetical protein